MDITNKRYEKEVKYKIKKEKLYNVGLCLERDI